MGPPLPPALEGLFAPDVVSYADGGGIVTAAAIPATGCNRVAKYIAGVNPRWWLGVTLEWIEVNTQMSLAIVREGEVVALNDDLCLCVGHRPDHVDPATEQARRAVAVFAGKACAFDPRSLGHLKNLSQDRPLPGHSRVYHGQKPFQRG